MLLCGFNKMFAKCGFGIVFLINYIFWVGGIKALKYYSYLLEVSR